MQPLRLAIVFAHLSVLLAFSLSAQAAGDASSEPAPRTTALRSLADDKAIQGGSQMTIAAIVNDEVISGFDLDQRVRLIVGSSGIQASPDEMRRIRAQVLRSLIDEKLKLQEAKRLKLEVKDQDIVDQLNYIASRNNVTVEDIKRDLKRQGVSIFTLTDQIKVDIAWNELVQGRFGPQARVTPEEVQRILDETRANSDKPQYDMLEIFLAVDTPEDDAKVHQQARDLVEQIKQGGAFSQVAANFSQSASAAAGGEMGWISPGQLAPELDAWIRTAHRGQVTLDPIKTLAGYYLLGVRDTRNVATGPSDARAPLVLKRLFYPLGAFASADAARRARDQLIAAASKVKGCNNIEEVAASFPGVKVEDLGQRPLAELPGPYQQRVAALVAGTASRDPIRTNEGWDSIVLCGQVEEEREAGLPSEQAIRERLFEQQMSMLSRRYLRDLRRDAVIDSRLSED